MVEKLLNLIAAKLGLNTYYTVECPPLSEKKFIRKDLYYSIETRYTKDMDEESIKYLILQKMSSELVNHMELEIGRAHV